MSELDDQRKAEWLRKVSGRSAQWSEAGDLVALTLCDVPAPSDTETQPSISPQERVRRERLAQRELIARSSGGPVRRLDAED
jgi:hypothetical protein